MTRTLTTGFIDRSVRTKCSPQVTALKNGKLLDAAEGEGFDVLVTGDKSLSCEQNLTGRRLAVIPVSAAQPAIGQLTSSKACPLRVSQTGTRRSVLLIPALRDADHWDGAAAAGSGPRCVLSRGGHERQHG